MSTSYVARFYREQSAPTDLSKVRVCVGESDLMVAVPHAALATSELARSLVEEIESHLLSTRRALRAYIDKHPEFERSFVPVEVGADAPPIAVAMADAAAKAGVGPMAAVAGAVAECIGRRLAERFSDVIVENGGDIYICSTVDRTVGIYAGRDSRLSGKLSVLLRQDRFPLGICTSAGTIGPSVSLGRADAAVAIARDTSLADAAATSIGNHVQTPADLARAAKLGSEIQGLMGLLVVKGDKVAIWGDVELA